jgi:hypothetical protein
MYWLKRVKMQNESETSVRLKDDCKDGCVRATYISKDNNV